MYMISWIIHTFWLFPIPDLLEDRHIDDIKIFSCKINRFHVAVGLYSNRSHQTFWRHLWSITEQKHGIMGSICSRNMVKHVSSWSRGLVLANCLDDCVVFLRRDNQSCTVILFTRERKDVLSKLLWSFSKLLRTRSKRTKTTKII